jgi:hypothetical protein
VVNDRYWQCVFPGLSTPSEKVSEEPSARKFKVGQSLISWGALAHQKIAGPKNDRRGLMLRSSLAQSASSVAARL